MEAEVVKLTDKQLENIRRFLLAEIPYYTRFSTIGSFADIPVINKTVLRNHFTEMLNPRFSKEDLVEEHTTGTTGEPLRLVKTKQERTKLSYYTWKWRSSFFGIHPASPAVYFTTFYDNKKRLTSKRYSVIGNTIQLSEVDFSDETLNLYCDLLDKVRPEWIYCTPTILKMFANFVKRNEKRLPKSIKYIEVTGEFFSKQDYLISKEVFDCHIGNQYGTRETWAIAHSCPNGRLHVNEDAVHVEAVEQDGVQNRCCVTSLINRALPIVRYVLDDKVEVVDSECNCGSKAKWINVLEGRVGQILVGKNGEQTSALVFRYIVEELNLHHGAEIIQFQAEQVAPDSVIVRIVQNSKKKKDVSTEFNKTFKQLCNVDIRFHFEYLPFIEVNHRGKLNHFIPLKSG